MPTVMFFLHGKALPEATVQGANIDRIRKTVLEMAPPAVKPLLGPCAMNLSTPILSALSPTFPGPESLEILILRPHVQEIFVSLCHVACLLHLAFPLNTPPCLSHPCSFPDGCSGCVGNVGLLHLPSDWISSPEEARCLSVRQLRQHLRDMEVPAPDIARCLEVTELVDLLLQHQKGNPRVRQPADTSIPSTSDSEKQSQSHGESSSELPSCGRYIFRYFIAHSLCLCSHPYLCVYDHVCVYDHMCMCMCALSCARVCMIMYICVCSCIYMCVNELVCFCMVFDMCDFSLECLQSNPSPVRRPYIYPFGSSKSVFLVIHAWYVALSSCTVCARMFLFAHCCFWRNSPSFMASLPLLLVGVVVHVRGVCFPFLD